MPIDTTLALVAGLVLAIGLSFGFEYLDNRITTPYELKSVLPIRFLGMVPSIEHGKNMQVNLLLNNGVPREFSEAFETVRSNVLLFSSAKDRIRSLVVTSADPGEGKSLVASNLAIALAQGGQRVLLIDADMRRSRVHEIFGGDLEPGLSNVLAGNCKTSEAIHESPVTGLWLMHAGLIPPNPAELLGRRYTDFMASLDSHFDWMVLDTPPVIVVPDSSIAASLGSRVVFVVDADHTSRQSARAALARLEASGAHMLGTVLNRVDRVRTPYCRRAS